jgi:hypothetical protein
MDNQAKDFPVYGSPIEHEIDYEIIQDEVRCGQYYLRIWNNQQKE